MVLPVGILNQLTGSAPMSPSVQNDLTPPPSAINMMSPGQMPPTANFMGVANAQNPWGNQSLLGARSPMASMSSMGSMPPMAPRRFAEGGLTSLLSGDDDMSAGMNAAGEASADADDEPADEMMIAAVQQIFEENIDNPRAIADKLLELVKELIAQSVGPEGLAELQSPEGQLALQRSLKEMMSQFGGQGGNLGQSAQSSEPAQQSLLGG